MNSEDETSATTYDLPAYFHSIEKSFEAAIDVDDSPVGYDGSSTTGVFFLPLLFSVIPAIPAAAYFASRWAKHTITVSFHGTHVVPVHSFLFWYLACTALFAGLFGLRLRYSSVKAKRSRPKTEPGDLLNDAQMRFALCYSVQSEIELYRTNKRSIHMEKARRYWRRLLRSLREVLGFEFDWRPGFPDALLYREAVVRAEMHGPDSQRADDHFFPQVHNLLASFPWFRLERTTESIISAFDGLRPKLHDRIIAKKDLYEVYECLAPLTLYLFTQIPDIPDTQEEKANLLEIEKKALNSFAEKMAQIAPYTFDRKLPTAFQKAAAKEARINKIFVATVGNPSAFIRFCFIWLVVQVFLAIAVPIFVLATKNLRFDSTLIALLLGSPLAISAALTAIPATSRRTSDDLRQN